MDPVQPLAKRARVFGPPAPIATPMTTPIEMENPFARLRGEPLSAAAASVPLDRNDAQRMDHLVRWMIDAHGDHAPGWQDAALVLFRRMNDAGIQVTDLVRADQLDSLVHRDACRLITFLVRHDRTGSIAGGLRASIGRRAPSLQAADGPYFEAAIRKGEGLPYRSPARDNSAAFRNPYFGMAYLASTAASPSGRKPDWAMLREPTALSEYLGHLLVANGDQLNAFFKTTTQIANRQFGKHIVDQLVRLSSVYQQQVPDVQQIGITEAFRVHLDEMPFGLTLTFKKGADGTESIVRVYDPAFRQTHSRASNNEYASFECHHFSDYLMKSGEWMSTPPAWNARESRPPSDLDNSLLRIEPADFSGTRPFFASRPDVAHSATASTSMPLDAGPSTAPPPALAGLPRTATAISRGGHRHGATPSQRFPGLSGRAPIAASAAIALPSPGPANSPDVVSIESRLADDRDIQDMEQIARFRPGDSLDAYADVISAVLKQRWRCTKIANPRHLKAFVSAVLSQESLPEHKKVHLLGTHKHPGLASFPLAFTLRSKELLKALVEAIVESPISEESKVNLLDARNGDRIPCLASTAGSSVSHRKINLTTCLEMFTQAVLESSLSPAAKIKVLTPSMPNGVPWLDDVRSRGNDRAVGLFTAVVRKHASPDVAARVLGEQPSTAPMAKAPLSAHTPASPASVDAAVVGANSMTVPHFQAPGHSMYADLRTAGDSLHQALRNDRPEDVMKTVQTIVAMADEPEGNRISALAPMDTNGSREFSMAMAEGRVAVVDAYVRAVVQSSLTDDVKAELLVARSSDGWPALATASGAPGRDTIASYVHGVVESSLGTGTKMQILCPIGRNERPWSHYLAGDLRDEILTAYRQAILASNLTQAQKQLLIDAAGG